MEIKTTMRYHKCSSIVVAKNKITDNSCVYRRHGKLELSYTVGRNIKWNNHFRKVWQLLAKLNILYDTAILLLRCLPQRNENICLPKAILEYLQQFYSK